MCCIIICLWRGSQLEADTVWDTIAGTSFLNPFAQSINKSALCDVIKNTASSTDTFFLVKLVKIHLAYVSHVHLGSVPFWTFANKASVLTGYFVGGGATPLTTGMKNVKLKMAVIWYLTLFHESEK